MILNINPTHVVLVTGNQQIAEIVMETCKKQKFPLVIVDLGMINQPLIPSGLRVSITKFKEGDFLTQSNAASLGAIQAESDLLLISDSTYNTLSAIHSLMVAASRIPKLAALHGDPGGIPGTRSNQWVPLFGTYYTNRALKATGYFDGSIRDVSLAASEWANRAQKKGWVSVSTMIPPERINENPVSEIHKEYSLLSDGTTLDQKDNFLLAPSPQLSEPWKGPTRTKPWQSKVTVSIPHYGENLRQLKLAIDLWRAQTIKPFLDIRDTGTPTKFIPDLLSLESVDLEIHFSRWRGLQNHYEFQALACEHALVDCRTPYLVLTHNDVFLTHQTVLEELLSQCDKNQPVVGYEMYPRGDFPYQGMVSHTLTILHVETLDRIRASWNPRWLKNCQPQNKSSRGWPSAEVSFNTMLRNAGIKPRIIGNDLPLSRQVTPHFDHVNSYTTSLLYYPTDKPRVESELLAASLEAESRLNKWIGF